jgi:hypothetical protein
MLRHFEDEAVAVVVGFKRRKDRGQCAVERNVDDSADDLRNAAGCSQPLPSWQAQQPFSRGPWVQQRP